jgi:hypothetical protein
MPKLARCLMLVATLAAVNLAAMTAVAQAHTGTDPASPRHRAPGRVGFLATDTDQPSGQADATVRRLLANERSAMLSSEAAHPRLLLDEERSSLLNLPDAAPAQATVPVRPAPPGGPTDWRLLALSVLAAVLALVAAVAVLAARRARRSLRAGQMA